VNEIIILLILLMKIDVLLLLHRTPMHRLDVATLSFYFKIDVCVLILRDQLHLYGSRPKRRTMPDERILNF
jgi:hypothetical protein